LEEPSRSLSRSWKKQGESRAMLFDCFLNEWMNKGWNTIIWPMHCDLQWSVVLPLLVTPLSNLTLRIKCRTLCIWPQSSNLFPKNIGPGD
jgi:hypothetical protein